MSRVERESVAYKATALTIKLHGHILSLNYTDKFYYGAGGVAFVAADLIFPQTIIQNGENAAPTAIPITKLNKSIIYSYAHIVL